MRVCSLSIYDIMWCSTTCRDACGAISVVLVVISTTLKSYGYEMLASHEVRVSEHAALMVCPSMYVCITYVYHHRGMSNV